jgi:hypothetical protein
MNKVQMTKYNIAQTKEIKEFCKANDINFIQWASNPDRIYLTTSCKKGKCVRKAKIDFEDFESDINQLENFLEELKK